MCASEPDGIAAGAGALPRARRRCEAGKRTHGPGPRACLALLAATALLALAAPAQAQPTTVTQSGEGATWSLVGENTVAAGQQTYTYTLTRTSGSRPLNEYFGFTSDTLEAETGEVPGRLLGLHRHKLFLFHALQFIQLYGIHRKQRAFRGENSERHLDSHVLTLKVATGTPTGTTVTLGVVSRSGVPRSGGLQITVATAPTNTAPTVANTIPNQTATAGTAFSYAFLANTFADTDPGDTLTYTATQSDDTALPSWLSFAAATRTFSGTPTAADVGTVSVKVTASDGHGGSVSDTFDIVVSAAAGVTVSTSALTVTEEDTTGNTYTVVLDTRPTANVTVTVAGHGGTDVTLTPSILTFTTANWNLAQTVTVKAGNDTDTTNDTVTLTHSAASTDSNYGGITIGSVVVTVADNDTANTAPTAANKTVTTGEDRAYAFTADDFGFDDADAGDTLASVTIVTVPAAGSLALDGTAVMVDDVVTKAQIDGDMLTFTPARDAHGAPYTTFTFTVNDGTDDSASAYTMTIDVTDAPLPVCGVPSFGDRREIWSGTVTVAPLQVFLGGIINGYGFELSAADGTLLPSRAFSTGLNDYTIASIGVRVSGAAVFSLVSSDGTLTTAEAAALRLHFCDESFDFDTTTARQASLYEWDSTLDWSPPVVTRTVYLSLPGNNVATGEPAITGTAQAGQELTADASPIMDADGLPSIFTYQWVRVDADGTSNPVDITDANAATYTLTNDDVGKRIKVKVSFTDELGSVEMRTSAATATVTAAATANTAPTAANKTVTTGEDRAYAFTADDFGFVDADAGDTLASVTIVTVPAAGTLALDGTAVVADDVVTKAQIDGDMLTFTPALDAHGAPYTTFTFTVNDGTDDSASAYTMTIDVTDTPATVTVAVTSTPTSLADTYGFGETIVITVTASEAVEVVGDPEFEFSMNNPGGAANDVPATYDGTRSSPTTIVFTYTVQAGDMDSDGIWIGDHSRTFMLDVNDRIRTASQQIDIDRTHPEKGTLAGHKVDGSLGAPTVPPDPTAPTLVSATATTLTIEWTHPGDGGSPLTRNFIEYRVEGTTDWTNWYRGETPTPVTRTVITNLQAATAYDVRVHSRNAIGNSQWTQSATAFSTLAGTASCPVPTFAGRRKIWTGVLTMGDFNDVDLSLRGYHSNPESGDGGGLDPATFTLGSRDYDVRRIALVTSGASGLHFIAGRGDGVWWDSTVDALRLHVCNTSVDFSDSVYQYEDEDRGRIASNHLWTTDLDWSGVTTRTVHLSLPLNRPATGAPVITGPATVGQVLAVDVTGIEDEDGLHDIEYTYQWVRVDADGTSNEADITDETDATYTLTDDDLGKKVKIEVSFPDDFGSDEQRTSAPTDTVTAVAMTTPGVTVSTTALTVTEEDTTGDGSVARFGITRENPLGGPRYAANPNTLWISCVCPTTSPFAIHRACPLRSACMISMPRKVRHAVVNRLKPSIGRVRSLMNRWSCSMMLFRYLHWRRFERGRTSPSCRTASNATG